MTRLKVSCLEAMDIAWDAPSCIATAVLKVIDDRDVIWQGSTIQGGVMIPADASPLHPPPTGTAPPRPMTRTIGHCQAARAPSRSGCGGLSVDDKEP